MAGIVYADYYTPMKCVKASDIFSHINDGDVKKEEFFRNYCKKNTDAERFNIYVENEKDEIEVFSILAERFFNHSKIQPGEISHLIYASPYNAFIGEISIAFVLHKHFNLKNACVMTIEQQCVSVMQAVQIAASLIDSGVGSNIMIACISHGMQQDERFIGTTIIGDGAAIYIIGKENCEAKIIDALSISDGSYSYNAYHKKTEEVDFLQDVRRGTNTVHEILSRKGLEAQDLKMIIPQNVNYHVYYLYSKFLGIDREKIYLKNIFDGGHLRDVDTIRNYVDALRDYPLLSGDKFMLFGSGLNGNDSTYNAILLEYCL